MATRSTSSPNTALPRVLVIDDDRETGEVLAQLLTLRGYAVDFVVDAGQGLECFRSRQHQVVVSDLTLDGSSGLEIAETLSNARRRPLLIAVTGHAGKDVARRSLEAGFDHHLVKPIEWGVFEKLLSSAHA